MTSHAHITTEPETETDWFHALMRLARFLRSPEGCPWDREQTARDFAGFIVEEGQELLDAFEEGDNDDIAEEWGDTFFCMLASMAAAEAEGRFDLCETLARAHEKMVRRHGHVFGEQAAATPDDAVTAWNQVKAREKRGKPTDPRVPRP